MADTAIATTDEPGNRLGSLKDVARSPAARQLLLLVAVAAAVALGVAVVLWSRGPNYGLLYAGLDQRDAAAITQELQAVNAPYKLGSDGSSIMAPTADLGALRLKLAAKGLPQGSAALDKPAANDSPFGMSDLAERRRYQQMLETDLGSTIGTLQSVRSARVHLALPKPSAFLRDNHEASASVLLSLYQGRTLDAGQVAAIVHLVASSVPGLDANQVSVVDQQGRLLTGNNSDPAELGNERLRMATRMENGYAQRIEELLTPLVGPGRVRAQVNVDLDFSRSEKATESYGHDHPALRSEQVSSESRSGGAAPGGIPGALSNQPPATVPQPTAAKPNAGAPATPGASTASSTSGGDSSNSSSATRNYELDRTISHVSDPAGRLARITVAVLVDDKLMAAAAPVVAKDAPDAKEAKDGKSAAAVAAKSMPFSAQELQRMTDLVKNAVGFDPNRGDSVSVINQAFHHAAPVADPDVPLWQRPGMLDLIKQVGGVLIALLVAFGLLRPLLKGLLRGPEPVAALPGASPGISVRVGDDDEDDDAPARLDGVKPVKLEGLTLAQAYEQRVEGTRQLVAANSKQVAQVVRNWVNEDGG